MPEPKDPVDEYFSALASREDPNAEQLDPVDEYLSGLDAGVQTGPDEETRSAWDRFIAFTQNVQQIGITRMGFGGYGEEARQVLGAGVINSALIEPAQGVLGLPGLFTSRELLTDKAANFMARSKQGLFTAAEQNAKEAGLSDEMISDSYAVGNFIGFTVPTVASLKGAALVLRAPGVSISTHLAQGTLVTDLTAGAIFGGVFKPGDTLEERGKHLLEESAMFGVGRILLNTAALPFRAFRINRLRQFAASREVDDVLREMENGRPTPVIESKEQAESLMSLLSEESYISTSSAGQDILARSQDESALVQSILEVHKVNGTGGRLTNFSSDFVEANASLDRFRQQFPGLKFELAKTDAGYDAIFSSKGLNNRQRAQLKREGRFEGMRVYRQGAEYEYVGAASREGYVKLRRTDGTLVEAKTDNITDLPIFREEIDPTPDIDALYQDFRESLDSNTKKAASMLGAIPEEDLIRSVREGKIKISDDGRRAFDVGGAIVYPEELGLQAGEQGLAGVVLRPGQNKEAIAQGIQRVVISRNSAFGSNPGELPWRATIYGADGVVLQHRAYPELEAVLGAAQKNGWEIAEAITNFSTAGQVGAQITRHGTRFANILEPPPVARFEDIFDAWAESKGIVSPEVINPLARKPIRDPLPLPVLAEGVDPALVQGAWNELSARYPRLISRIREIRPVGDKATVAGGKLVEGGDVRALWRESEGVLFVNPRRELDPYVLYHEITHVAQGARGQIPKGRISPETAAALEIAPVRRHRAILGELEAVKDYEAARAFFARRLRQEMWAMVPEEDRLAFSALRDAFDTALESGVFPLRMAAHQKGFHMERLSAGAVELREISTGMRFKFANEELARAGLSKVVRSERDMLGGLMELDSNGMPSLTGGGRSTDGEWNFGPQIFAKEFLENIPFAPGRNVRDWLTSIENMSGVPLFTQGFDLVDTGLSRMRNRYEPWAKEIQKTWRGLSVEDKAQVAEFWRDMEGTDISLAAAVNLARDRGMTTRQITAWTRARGIMDEGYKLAGLPGGKYIHHYYARVRPWVEANNAPPDFNRIFLDETVPPEFEFFAEFARTGEMAMVEMDPEIVMHKWFRSMMFQQEVKPHWDRLAALVDRGWGPYKKPALRVSDLPQAQIEQILKINPHVDLSDPVLARPIRDVISEYLTVVRGNPGTGLETLRRFNKKFFNSLGVEADERIMEEFFNTAMSNMYGSAMAARPSLVARNMTQNVWNLYPRLGAKHMQSGLGKAMTQEGFIEALDAGAIRMADAGVPFGDAIFENMMSRARIEGTTPFGKAVAASVRKGLRLGYVSRKVAEKLLIPYSSGEQISRAWAYHWQKEHTARLLNQFETRRIGWDKFVEDGLPFFSEPVKGRFENLYRLEGKESALRFIGKMASDETNFIYGVGAQPAWMQRPLGRMFGMFGTWPLWAIELYGRRTFSGSIKQQAAFWGRTLVLTGAFGNMMAQSGVDMWNWISPLGVFGWAGGPMADHAINTKQIIDAPMDQKGAAFKRLITNVGRLSFPGQLFYHDLSESLSMDNPRDQFMRMMMGRPVDQDHYSMRYMFGDDKTPSDLQLQDPATAEAIRNPWMERQVGELYPGEVMPSLQGMTKRNPMGENR